MKRISFFVLVCVMMIVSAVSAASFTDVHDTDRFYDEMMFLEGKSIISGYSDGSFRPNEAVTRGAAAIMIGRALDLDGTKQSTTFSDVGPNQAASGYIASAVKKGIISGFPDGTYRPDSSVTRGQMAIFVARAFDLTTEADVTFTDISPAMAAYPYIQRILADGITAGYPDGTYKANVIVTRAQFSAFLARALDDQFKVETASFAMDQSKTYTYAADEVGTIVYTFKETESNGWNVWTTVEGGTESDTPLVEREDASGYYTDYLTEEGPVATVQLLKYPVFTGQTWTTGWDGTGEVVITSTTETVTTPAGTFEHVVEVSGIEGDYQVYYAPGIGRIKSVVGGATILELTALR